ncbi:MAG: phytoene/squalene synthase family protein [Polyangiales bacterium]
MSASASVSEGTLVARKTIAHHSKSFALAARLLPKSCRDDVVVLYAWCRRADDAIDLAPEKTRGSALAALRSEIDAIYRGEPQDDDVLRELQRVVMVHEIPHAYPRELLNGMQMDVEGTRYETFDALLHYCFRVAGVVGLMMCHVMGVRDEKALRRAAHLGMAMQLTNICRDVAEDWEHFRLYLPRETLASAAATDVADRAFPSPLPLDRRQPIARTVAMLIGESERYYRSGDIGLSALSFRCAFAVCTARLVYAAIGEQLGRRGFDALRGRVSVPLYLKLYLVLKALLLTLRTLAFVSTRSSQARIERVVRFPHDVLPI